MNKILIRTVTVLAIENVTGPAYNEVNNADHPQQILQSASNAAEQEKATL